MAEIAGVTFDWTDYSDTPTDPRIMRIPVPLVEATVQDLTDTLSARQADLDNLIYDQLLDGPGTGGKQDLGGGVLVGLTTTTKNVVVSFEARKDSVREGTVTTGDANGILLTDTGATFISSGVTPGAWVMNLTDGSMASVLRVKSETQLITDGLGDGIDNQWDLNDAYEVRLVVQVEIAGGNLVAIDSIGDPREVVLPTAGTQVIRTSASSATLRESEAIEFSSYNGGVTVALSSPYSGTVFPTGTLQQPVNNMTDALSIANDRGLSKFFLLEDVTLQALDFTAKTFVGSVPDVTVTVDASAIVDSARFENVGATGTFDSLAYFICAVVSNCSALNGAVFERCRIGGTIGLSGPNQVIFIGCVDDNPVSDIPTIDMTGLTADVAIRGYFGSLELANKAGASAVTVDLAGGRVIIDASVTTGSIRVRGIGHVENSGTATLDAADLVTNASVADAVAAHATIVDIQKKAKLIPGLF